MEAGIKGQIKYDRKMQRKRKKLADELGCKSANDVLNGVIYNRHAVMVITRDMSEDHVIEIAKEKYRNLKSH